MLRKALWVMALVGVAVFVADRMQAFAAEKGDTGAFTGVITAKGETWIEVRTDGEEGSKRYIPRWIGGMPANGGGFEKSMLEKIAKVKAGDHVNLSWLQEEHLRVPALEVIAAVK